MTLALPLSTSMLAKAAAEVVMTGRASAVARVDLDATASAANGAATHLETLRRLHESGAGLFGGVREVLAAGREGRLNGILGTVAELYRRSGSIRAGH